MNRPGYYGGPGRFTDDDLLACLANTLAVDGVPALMLIVGETDISISLGEGTLHE